MLLKGDLKYHGSAFRCAYWDDGKDVEIILVLEKHIVSAYRLSNKIEYMYGDNKAREVYRAIKASRLGIKNVKKKDIFAVPLNGKGVQQAYTYKKNGIENTVYMFGSLLSGLTMYSTDIDLEIDYSGDTTIIPTDKIDYTQITVIQNHQLEDEFLDGEVAPKVRSLAEISFEKDTTWLKEKKYYIVDNPTTAERIFSYIDKRVKESLEGGRPFKLAYDIEATGLRMNQFCKYGSVYAKDLAEHNRKIIEHNLELEDKGRPREEYLTTTRVDKLVGIILCWEDNVSYYFPCGHKYMSNLYEKEQYQDAITQQIVQDLKIWSGRHSDKDMAKHVKEVVESKQEFSSDVLLMQRCRYMLENGFIIAHNGSFEWKSTYIYDIVINLKGDTMLLHQVVHKFRNTTSNRGESSALKYLANKEFGIDQLDLHDFFTDYKEDTENKVKSKKKKKKKKGSNIDFSYMNYEGTLAYAPADGDITLQLYNKYMDDLDKLYPEMKTIYEIEVIVASAVGYMEFSGHRIDEEQIEATRLKLVNKCDDLERKIREIGGLKADKNEEGAEELNLGSPKQLIEYFFTKLQIPFTGDKPSVAKNVLKAYLKQKNEDGTNKYQVLHYYSDWKKNNTLLTKFFDSLQDFMYPGGYIFSSFGQISTATGRMSCRTPKSWGFIG